MRTFLRQLLNDRSVILYILVAGILCFRLSSYPWGFDAFVEHSIHAQVNHVIDHAPYPAGEVTWLWTDMHQHGAGRSPVYSVIVELGLRAFGLSLLAVRMPVAVIAFMSLVFAHRLLARIYGRPLVDLALLLLATSPWFLVFARSGGIVGLSSVYVLFSLSLITWYFRVASKPTSDPSGALGAQERSRAVGVLGLFAGTSVALMPYMYAAIRPIPIIILGWIVTQRRNLGWRSVTVFILPSLVAIVLQLGSLHESAYLYMRGRGESIVGVAVENQDGPWIKMIGSAVWSDVIEELRLLVGWVPQTSWWSGNVAESYWRGGVLLYPRYLVPCFIIGVGVWSFQAVYDHSYRRVVPLLYLVVSLVPCVVVGIGGPNLARNCLLLVPLYFFIAFGCYCVFGWITRLKLSRPVRRAFYGCSAIIFVAVCSAQVENFFGQPKGESDDMDTPMHDEYHCVLNLFRAEPQVKVVIHESIMLGNYSYVLTRWLGGERFRKLQSAGQIVYLTEDNAEIVQGEIAKNQIDYLVTTDLDDLYRLIPELRSKQTASVDRIFMIQFKRPLTPEVIGGVTQSRGAGRM